MKHTQNPTLSAYLLEKANRFLLYPQRISGTRADGSTRKMFDEIRHKMVEWRKTFAPQSENDFLKILGSPISVDELYCRELLKAIPNIVKRTLSLTHLTLTGISGSEFVYLREAANCYILGLPQSAVALARAAVENALRKKLEKIFGKSAVAGADFKVLIDDYGSRAKSLSRERRDLAHKVRIAGNDVLHQQNMGSANALEVIEAARMVILELVGSKATPGATSKST